eukprot:683249-Ditylum_brightwellii.AAC.2
MSVLLLKSIITPLQVIAITVMTKIVMIIIILEMKSWERLEGEQVTTEASSYSRNFLQRDHLKGDINIGNNNNTSKKKRSFMGMTFGASKSRTIGNGNTIELSMGAYDYVADIDDLGINNLRIDPKGYYSDEYKEEDNNHKGGDKVHDEEAKLQRRRKAYVNLSWKKDMYGVYLL